MSVLKVGDKVYWSGNYGNEPYKEARVIKIERNIREGERFGLPIEEVDWNDISNCVVILDIEELENFKWAYGYQLKPTWTTLDESNSKFSVLPDKE